LREEEADFLKKVRIIGAGLAGSEAAWQCARRGMAVDSMVSGGCIISGAHVSRSLLFSNCRINSFARAQDAVVLPDANIGRHARLNRVVIDRGCDIPEGMVIGEDPKSDAERFYVSESGITLVTPEMLDGLAR